ncbi:glycosyltransferase family 2 protein [Sphingomonas sp. Leaf230]|uniref:glycosyltransferase family 2 protein n=1 Tax=Sphingomonas sp. Leaf230 TaxID=1735694 RepID=UPI0009EA84E9|nr:glycosyltransferase family 2 protein [Sphingomonas sp. Leaf230]
MNSNNSRRFSEVAPVVSLIIACFNASSTLSDAIISVLTQGRGDVELIVIDGQSTDRTIDVIRRYDAQIDYWISELDNGIYHAWNKGVRVARGSYICFLGADDILLPGALDAYARQIAMSPEAEFLSSRVRYGEGEHAPIIGLPWRWKQFRRYMTTAHVGSMHRRSLFDRVGLYDESFMITGDYELLLRAGHTLKTAFLNVITVQMGVGGISSGRSNRVFLETADAKRRHSGLPAWIVTVDRWRATLGFRLRGLLSR